MQVSQATVFDNIHNCLKEFHSTNIHPTKAQLNELGANLAKQIFKLDISIQQTAWEVVPSSFGVFEKKMNNQDGLLITQMLQEVVVGASPLIQTFEQSKALAEGISGIHILMEIHNNAVEKQNPQSQNDDRFEFETFDSTGDLIDSFAQPKSVKYKH